MFLHTKFKLPKELKGHVLFKPEDLDPETPYYNSIVKPSYLTTLKDCTFPEWVKTRIVEICKGIGVENPLDQKLVEPFAFYFHGAKKEGVPDFKYVDWQHVIAYFEFEAVSITLDVKRAIKLQNRAMKKYGFGFHHKLVYGEDY